MAASDRSSGQQRVAGGVVLVAILGTAWAATSIPRLFEASRVSYVATTNTIGGAAGLEPGGPVLYGGAPRGMITSIETSLPDGAAVGEIRIAFELDRSLPLAQNASIVRSVGIAGSGGALSVIAPGDPAFAFAGDVRRVIPLNHGSVAPADGLMVLLGRRNAEMVRSIQTSLQALDEDLGPRMDQLAKIARSIRTLLDRLELDVESEDLQESIRTRVAVIVRRLQTDLPELQRSLISSGNAMRALEQDVRQDGSRIRRSVAVATRNLDEVLTAADDIEATTRATILPKVLQIRRASLQAVLDSERVLADGTTLLSEASTSIPKALANMKLAGGQLTLAFENLLGLALEAIMISPDVDSETRRRLLEAVNSAVRAGMDARLAADRMRNLTKIDPSRFEADPDSLNAFVEPFQAAVNRLDAILDQLSRTVADAVVADGDAPPTPAP
jgi:hypothetical protein